MGAGYAARKLTGTGACAQMGSPGTEWVVTDGAGVPVAVIVGPTDQERADRARHIGAALDLYGPHYPAVAGGPYRAELTGSAGDEYYRVCDPVGNTFVLVQDGPRGTRRQRATFIAEAVNRLLIDKTGSSRCESTTSVGSAAAAGEKPPQTPQGPSGPRPGPEAGKAPDRPVCDALGILAAASAALAARGKEYDLPGGGAAPGGERSAGGAARLWSAWSGREMTELEAWMFLVFLKTVRLKASQPGSPQQLDSAADGAAYLALAGECKAAGGRAAAQPVAAQPEEPASQPDFVDGPAGRLPRPPVPVGEWHPGDEVVWRDPAGNWWGYIPGSYPGTTLFLGAPDVKELPRPWGPELKVETVPPWAAVKRPGKPPYLILLPAG